MLQQVPFVVFVSILKSYESYGILLETYFNVCYRKELTQVMILHQIKISEVKCYLFCQRFVLSGGVFLTLLDIGISGTFLLETV